MPNVESKPVTTSIRVDHEHTIEMRADMANKTAEVENLTTGEMYSGGGGGDSDFSTTPLIVKIGDGNEGFLTTGFIVLAGVPVVFQDAIATAASGEISAENEGAEFSCILYKNSGIDVEHSLMQILYAPDMQTQPTQYNLSIESSTLGPGNKIIAGSILVAFSK